MAVGGNGEALAAILLTLPDHDHSAFWMAPEAVARQVRDVLFG